MPTGRRASERRASAAAGMREAQGAVRISRRPVSCRARCGARRNDAESRYWRARAATELALAAFAQLESLPDSRERREVRATLARARTSLCGRHRGAQGGAEDLRRRSVAARRPRYLVLWRPDYEQAVATLLPLLKVDPDDPRLLDRVRRLSAAVTTSRRGACRCFERAVARDATDPLPRLALAPRLRPEG